MPKGDFIIEDGSITLKILSRIKADDKSFGANYTERAKKIASYFKEQFSQMRTEQEGPDYFRHKLIKSFAYKEYEVVKEVKQHLDESMLLYHEVDKYVGSKANILHITDDYGETTALLALQQPQRKIFTYIANEEKRDVAKTNYINKIRTIKYISNFKEERNYDIVIAHAANANMIPTVSARVIIIGDFEKEVISGFEVEVKGSGFIILRRHSS